MKPKLNRASPILVTNDDGIDAEGLAVLTRIAKKFSNDVWVVAPLYEQSGTAHGITWNTPLRAYKYGAKKYSIDGTPTDCVMMGVMELMRDNPPALILSGINRGANLADTVTYSGTIAGAMEGTILNVPSIALSALTVGGQKPHWAALEEWGAKVLKKLIHFNFPPQVFLSVNFPYLPAKQIRGMKVTTQGQQDIGGPFIKRQDPNGRDYYWMSAAMVFDNNIPGTDVAAVNEGYISVTPLHVNLTAEKSLNQLKKIVA